MVRRNKEKLGIVIDSIETSHRMFVMNQAVSKALQNKTFGDIVVFYNNVGPNIMAPPCAYMHTNLLHGFNGLVLVSDIAGMEVAQQTGVDFFYVWELEWLQEGRIPHYDAIAPYYTNPDVVYATRSPSYRDILQNNFNARVEFLSPDFNLEVFRDYTVRRSGEPVLH